MRLFLHPKAYKKIQKNRQQTDSNLEGKNE